MSHLDKSKKNSSDESDQEFFLPQWTANNILRAMMGFVSSDNPKKSIHRIFYWSLITISMNYSMYAFSGIFTVKMVPQVLPFDSVNESLNYGLPVYVPDFLYEALEPIGFSRLKKMAQITYHVDCLKELAKKRDRICVALHFYARHFVHNLTINEGRASIRLGETPFHEDNLAFAYARNSPFVERFDEMMTRIFESGIPNSWSSQLDYHKIRGPSDGSEKSYVDLSRLVMLLTIGMTISVACFILEMTFSSKSMSDIFDCGVNMWHLIVTFIRWIWNRTGE
ncbi:hypothetical protein QAD02_006524 [Eretmocerus hayati]|uniref:Uncharacterized protein n=1 Tax=Eretmocerus hayati TaxID=131215 RepID=A0ACC2N183_9HYME|nr:hypothetical protein QAD02_006524 [Eretmocerus hayati]